MHEMQWREEALQTYLGLSRGGIVVGVRRVVTQFFEASIGTTLEERHPMVTQFQIFAGRS